MNSELIRSILELSEAPEWSHAAKEWAFANAWESEDGERCLCGHHPIHDACLFTNLVNGRQAILGRDCSKKLMGVDTDALFASRKALLSGQGALSAKSVDLAQALGWFSPWEAAIYHALLRGKTRAQAQAAKRGELEARFSQAMSGGQLPDLRPKPQEPGGEDPMPWRAIPKD